MDARLARRRALPAVAGLVLAAVTVAAGCATKPGPSPVPDVSVAVVPRAPSVAPGGTIQFTAAVTGTAIPGVTWSAPDCGSITSGGLYTAPASASTCHVVATSQADPARSDRATVSVVDGGGAAAWRPFAAASPWNTPIPADPALHPDSAGLVDRFIASSPYGPHLDVNIPRYSIPLYEADPSTPTFPVLAELGGEGWDGWPATLAMPIPPGATPDPASDHHMLVVDRSRAMEWGCWNMSFQGGQWRAGVCATADLGGSGVRVPAPQAGARWWLAHGARACGFPLSAGLIRVDEIQAGRIDHALVIAYPGLQSGRFTAPASTPSGSGTANGVPCGGRFQFDPRVDVTSLGLSRSGQIIVRALQEYGAYVGDYSGALSLYAENSAAAQAYWASGVLDVYELQGKIDLTRFRVLELGTVY